MAAACIRQAQFRLPAFLQIFLDIVAIEEQKKLGLELAALASFVKV